MRLISVFSRNKNDANVEKVYTITSWNFDNLNKTEILIIKDVNDENFYFYNETSNF